MDDFLLWIVIASIFVFSLIVFAFYYFKSPEDDEEKNRRKKKKRIKTKDRNKVIREANRKLSSNPKDPDALTALADLYYREQLMEKAFKTYEILIDLCATNPDLDEFEINLRYGLAALKLNYIDDAYKTLVIAKTMKSDVFELDFNLGYLEFTRKNYEKAEPLLRNAMSQKPDDPLALRYLGHTLFKLKKYKEANTLLRRAIDLAPDDKESLFAIAQCYYELNQNEQAEKIFTHLRPDPVLGPHAAMFAGTIHMNQHSWQKAAMDFEIGLRHQDIKPDLLIELKYRLAGAHIKMQDIPKALPLYKQVYDLNPQYKDITELIKRYSELSMNKNLQIFMLAPTSEFVSLCRKMTNVIMPKTKSKIIDITVNQTDYADILSEVHTKAWEDIVLFRFIRSGGKVGEFMVRDFHAHVKDLKAGRGFVVSAGSFSEEAARFVEARLIDLIDKEELMKLLHKLDHKLPATSTPRTR